MPWLREPQTTSGLQPSRAPALSRLAGNKGSFFGLAALCTLDNLPVALVRVGFERLLVGLIPNGRGPELTCPEPPCLRDSNIYEAVPSFH